jgi:hypothetical protein
MRPAPTQVFYAGTCRVPTLHPPASKVPVWNASRSDIAPCKGEVAAPGTRRRCHLSRTPNRTPPALKLPSWNASRLPHPSHPTCILRIDYSYVVGLWQLQSEQARAARRSFRETWCLDESTGAMHHLHSVPVRAPSIGRRGVETSVERTRDTPRGSPRTEPCGEEPTVSQPQHITSAARWFDTAPKPCGAQRSCLKPTFRCPVLLLRGPTFVNLQP